MITHLKARLLATAVALLVVLHPGAGHAQAAPVATASQQPAVKQLAHVSITALGKGPAIFLIPGLSSPRAVWDGVAPDLAKTHRVYVVQVNGFGGDAPGKNLEPGILDGIVADLDGFVVKNRIAAPKVVGHSMGGLVALMWAKAHPSRLSGAMIVDSLPFVGEIFVPGATVAMLAPQARTMRDALTASYGKPNLAYIEGTANGLALKPDSRVKVKAWMLAADPRVTGQALYEDMSTDLRPDIAALSTPLTIVYPWNTALPKERADTVYRGAFGKAPKVTFVDIGDAAHFVMLDQPASFATALRTFADAH